MGDTRTAIIQNIGGEKTPIVTIDNFLPDPVSFREKACETATFVRPDVAYPGMISGMAGADASAFVDSIRPVLAQAFSLPEGAPLGWSGLISLTSLPAESLAVHQTIPHIDDPRLFQVACVLYLFQSNLGGTGFFRQNLTGFECVTNDRYAEYRRSVGAELKRRASMPPNYIGRGDQDYTCVHEVPARFNRLVIYPSKLLHSGLVRGKLLSSNPETGRLTCNLFVGRAV